MLPGPIDGSVFLAQVPNEHMKKAELNVDLPAMDWSTLVSRRATKTPPAVDRGGWHISLPRGRV
jgi:hypothetical protein